MSTVVVTGVNGFLGSSIAGHFSTRGWQVIGVDRSLPSPELLQSVRRYHRWTLPDTRWRELLRDCCPEICVHCAGSASVPQSFLDPAADYTSGPPLVFNLLQLLRQVSPSTRFVFLSSAAVYGCPAQLPIGEEQTPAPISPYGIHKLQCEQLCQEFSRFFGLRTASLRVFSAYGRGLRRQVVWDICDKLTNNENAVLQGTGLETRDFVHAADVAQAVGCVSEGGLLQGECYNVATGQATAIDTLARQLTRLLGRARNVTFSGSLPDGTPAHWCADIGKLATLGYRPSVELGAGLRDFVAWFGEEKTWLSASA